MVPTVRLKYVPYSYRDPSSLQTCTSQCRPASSKAPCSFRVHTWALKGLPYHHFGVYVYTIKLHGAFGNVDEHHWQEQVRTLRADEEACNITLCFPKGPSTWTSKVPNITDQRPQIEGIGSIGSIVLDILEVRLSSSCLATDTLEQDENSKLRKRFLERWVVRRTWSVTLRRILIRLEGFTWFLNLDSASV